MHHQTALMLLGALLSAASAFAEPSARLQRAPDSGLELSAQLTKNEYRTETYQDSYTVQVPYQETETYYEDVPYTERVPYTDYEEYYENEYRCHTEYENDRQCRQERVCRPVPGEERCEIVQECGTNAHGQPICKERKVCHQGPGREDCDYVERCENVSRPRERCGYEQVRRTRQVTRYRDETRYRRETRTREVTRYREETRCCVTRTREVFDHSWSLPTKVIFPVGSELMVGEKESFMIEIAGGEASPDISFSVLESVFGYKIARKDVKPGSAVVTLALAPKYKADDVGAAKIKDLKLVVSKNGEAKLQMIDTVRVPRVASSYTVDIVDKETLQLITRSSAAATADTKIVIPLAIALPTDRDLVARVSIDRQGPVLENGRVQFGMTTEFLFDRIPADSVGAKSLVVGAYEESNDQIRLPFQDKGHSDLITTKYEANLTDEAGQSIWSQSAGAEILDAQGKAKFTLDAKLLAEDKTYKFTLKVGREGRRLTAPVSFEATQVVTRKLDLAAIKDNAKITKPSIQGRGEKAMLVFADKSPVHPLVKTQYRISTAAIGRWGAKTYLSEKTLERSQLVAEADGTLKLALSDLGVSMDALRKNFSAGATVYVSVEVFRTSPRVQGTISLWQGGNVVVP